MALELIYTSVPAGVKPGTRGFCTVACSRELPGPLAMTLESLSGYRHLFAPNSENARFNPVVRSHLTFKFNGSPVHLLSRIADAGYDYSQRTNKIAHHVVLRSKERPEAGPAELLARSDLFIEKWNEEPTIFPQDKAIPKFDVAPAACSVWRQITGDAGWGGILAAAAIRRQPVGLIFKVGQDVFPLYREAIALLPTNVRWETTFSTFYSKMSPGFDCLWRAVLLDSPEEPQVRAVPNSIFLDLTRPLGNVDSFVKDLQTAQWVEAARSGMRPQIASQSATPLGVPKSENAAPFKELSLESDDEELSIDDMLGDTPVRTGASPFAGDAFVFGGGRPTDGSPFAPQIKLRRKKSITRFILPLLFMLALIGAVGAAGYYYFSGQEKNKEDDNNNTEMIRTATEKSEETADDEAAKESLAEKNDVDDTTTQEDIKAEEERKAAAEAAKAEAERKAEEAAEVEAERKAEEAAKADAEKKLAEDKQTCQDFLNGAAKLCLPFSKAKGNYKDYSNEGIHAKKEEFASFGVNKLLEPCKEAIELCLKRNLHIQVKLEPFFTLSKFTYKTDVQFIDASNTDNNNFQYKFDWLLKGQNENDDKASYSFLTIDLNTNTGISIYHNYDKEWFSYINDANLCLLSTLTWQIVDKNSVVMAEAYGQTFKPFDDYPPLTFLINENTIFNKEPLFNKLIPEQELLNDGKIDQFYFSLELYQENSLRPIENVVEKLPNKSVTVTGEIISPLTFEVKHSVNNNQLSLITKTKYNGKSCDEGVNKELDNKYTKENEEVQNNKNLDEAKKKEQRNSLDTKKDNDRKDKKTEIDKNLKTFSDSIGYRILLKRTDHKDMSIVVVDVPPKPLQSEPSEANSEQPAN